MNLRRSPAKRVSAWIFVLGVLVAAVLLQLRAGNPAGRTLQEIPADPRRAVYGEPPARPAPVAPGAPTPPPQPDAQERNRADEALQPEPEPAEPPLGAPPASPEATRRPGSQPRKRNNAVAPQANAGVQPGKERFLHYRPPGAVVGDPGEFGSSEPATVEGKGTVAEVATAVHRWADTLLSQDLSAHLNLYAPILDTFFGQANVRKDAVRRAKEKQIASLASVQRFEIVGLRIVEDPGAVATAEFRREWMTQAAPGAPAMASERLVFRRMNGEWKIIGEESVSATR